MDISLRRLSLPGTLVLALLMLCTVPARAAAPQQPDWGLVAESIGEAGYYVDSNAKYFKTDKALDLLRGAQDKSTPVFIAVLPTAIKPATAIKQIQSAMNRKGTYVVLAGDKLQVASTALPKTTVRRAYSKAVAAHKGKPAEALVTFVRQLDERKVGKQVIGRPKTKTPGTKQAPAASSPQPGARLPGSAAPQAQKKDSGGSSTLPIVLGGLAVLAAAGAGGFFFLRRRSGSSSPTGT